ncbi:MAG: nitroreductase family protein [Candidatus Cloacimonetes bacterium]|nr:nitroreductase family protein [Candidatus Cloacimonadota bacterium]
MFKDLVIANRSYRRFYQDYNISADLLIELIDNARLSASAANLQPLRYIIVSEKEANERIFSCLRWAGYLPDWEGPEEGEKPSAYIVMLGDKEFPKFHHFDGGIAAQTILLGAVDKGLGGCIFASVDKERLQQEINIPSNMEIIVVIALGKPKEHIIIETAETSGNIKYWRDKDQIHHVPKRKLADILIEVIS